MKVKIITCHYAYNYGAVLQTYALTKYLNMQGLDTKVINYRRGIIKAQLVKPIKLDYL